MKGKVQLADIFKGQKVAVSSELHALLGSKDSKYLWSLIRSNL